MRLRMALLPIPLKDGGAGQPRAAYGKKEVYRVTIGGGDGLR